MWSFIKSVKDAVLGPTCSPSDAVCKLTNGKIILPTQLSNAIATLSEYCPSNYGCSVLVPLALTAAALPIGLNWLYHQYYASSETRTISPVEQAAPESKAKTLILHFDVNKTIIMEDAVSHKTRSYVIKCALSEDPQYKDKWEKHLPPMTYYEYINKHKLAKYKDPKQFKEKVKEEIENFINVLKAKKHRFYSEIKRRHDSALAKLNPHKTNIVPSFYQLIKWLEERKKKTGQDFRILIRTFGKDRNDIIKELRTYAKLNIVPADFQEDGCFVLKKVEGSKVNVNTSDLATIYDCWVNTNQHIAVQDNYERWDKRHQHWRYGKPYPFERNPQKAISIFFDDNIETNKASPTNIVAPFDVQTKQYVSVHESLEECTAFAVEPLKVIEDDNYYIDLVQAVLKKDLDKKMQTPAKRVA